MIEKKKNLLLSFDDKMLLQSRKILFKNNLTPQQFITYVFHQMNMGNDEVMELLEKASLHYVNDASENDLKNIKIINHDILYDLIEKGK